MINRLFTPGPTTIPPAVLKAMAQPLLYHKSSEFKELMRNVLARLQYVFCTQQIVLPLSCSATGAAEAVVASLHSAGDTVLVLNNGRFATRWRSMLELFGIEVINEEIEWGEAPTSEQVSRLLTTYQTISAVWIVQCETSTGTATNIKAIADIIHAQSNALVCVDGVSSVGAMECVMDEWKIDALICGSQKALMTPPGLGFVALSERAWNIVENRKSASYYFDLLRIRRAAEKHLGVFTPAVSLLMGVDAALQSIINEGLEQVIARHSRVASIIRDGVIECGLRLVPRFPANSLTVVTLENAPKIINQLQEKYGIIVAGGQDCFAGKVIRIGHLGYVFEEDARYFTECLKNIVGL